MKEQKVFYYKFEPVNAWFVFNCVLLITLGYGSFRCPCLLYWPQMQILWGTAVFSWLVWGYKYLLKHKMAVVTEDSIAIDHCRPLPWKDIKNAEEKTVRCGFRKYRVIVLHPKDNIDYKYNFLQKHNCNFTAFSIPLYGILSKEDEEEMTQIVKQKVPMI